jgi:hypothetical protein
VVSGPPNRTTPSGHKPQTQKSVLIINQIALLAGPQWCNI